MSDVNKEGSGTTVGQLRALLEKATPGEWFIGEQTGEVMSDTGHVGAADWREQDTELACALRNAAPDLLRVVEAVAKSNPGVPGSDGDTERCCLCGGTFMRWTKDGKLTDEAVEELHEDDCAWVLARKLTGAP